MRGLDELIVNYNEGFKVSGNSVNTVRSILEDFMYRICDKVDDELDELRTDVLSGDYTPKEIATMIESLKKKIY